MLSYNLVYVIHNTKVVAEVERAEEHQQRNEVTRRSNLDKYQTMNPREEMATTSHVPTQVGERSEQVTINQVSHQRSDGKQGSYEQQEARKQTSSLGQITTVLQVTTPKTPSSNQHSREEGTRVWDNDWTECILNDAFYLLSHVVKPVQIF